MDKYTWGFMNCPDEWAIHRNDRRAAARYPAGGALVQIGWRDGTGYQSTGAVLLDISLGGASGRTSNCLPRHETIWVRLSWPTTTGWVEAKTIAVKRSLGNVLLRRKAYVIRLRFKESCPYAFFSRAVRSAGRFEGAAGRRREDSSPGG